VAPDPPLPGRSSHGARFARKSRSPSTGCSTTASTPGSRPPRRPPGCPTDTSKTYLLSRTLLLLFLLYFVCFECN
jgi:hypothetical protein